MSTATNRTGNTAGGGGLAGRISTANNTPLGNRQQQAVKYQFK